MKVSIYDNIIWYESHFISNINLSTEGKLLWDVPTVSETSRKQAAIDWPRHYAALLEYGKEHGTCNIPHLRRYECDLPGLGENGSVFHYEGKLGSWLDRQRQSKKGFGKFNISEDQVTQLQILVDQGNFTCFYIQLC